MQLDKLFNEEDFASNALEVIKIKFVNSLDSVDEADGYAPEFAHQHFGEAEQIFGYKNLSISLCYSESSLFIHPVIKYDREAPSESDMQPDDILSKLTEQLPASQLNCMITNPDAFAEKLREMRTFRPFGELISQFTFEGRSNSNVTLQLYKLDFTEDEESNRFLERAQTLSMWFVDGASYMDYNDPRFFNYFLFEISENSDGSRRYRFAGYATLYRFYYENCMYCVRVAHMLLNPAYRHSGVGVKFLNAIYCDLCSNVELYDITAETHPENFLFMRDFADCVNCAKLGEFSPALLKICFSEEMKEAARKKLKLHGPQARRVYEILRLHHANMNLNAEREAYQAEVEKRLRKPLLRSKRDFSKLSEALDSKEMAVVSHNLDPVAQKQVVDDMYTHTVDCYRVVIDRLRRFESKLFN